MYIYNFIYLYMYICVYIYIMWRLTSLKINLICSTCCHGSSAALPWGPPASTAASCRLGSSCNSFGQCFRAVPWCFRRRSGGLHGFLWGNQCKPFFLHVLLPNYAKKIGVSCKFPIQLQPTRWSWLLWWMLLVSAGYEQTSSSLTWWRAWQKPASKAARKQSLIEV